MNSAPFEPIIALMVQEQMCADMNRNLRFYPPQPDTHTPSENESECQYKSPESDEFFLGAGEALPCGIGPSREFGLHLTAADARRLSRAVPLARQLDGGSDSPPSPSQVNYILAMHGYPDCRYPSLEYRYGFHITSNLPVWLTDRHPVKPWRGWFDIFFIAASWLAPPDDILSLASQTVLPALYGGVHLAAIASSFASTLR